MNFFSWKDSDAFKNEVMGSLKISERIFITLWK